MIRHRVQTGEWLTPCRTVWVLASAPETLPQRMSVGVLSRPAAFVSGRSAAFLHGFDGSVAPVLPEITVPYSATPRSGVAKVRRSQFFSATRVETVNQLSAASPAETLFAMAEFVGERRLIRYVDDLLLRDAGAVAELDRILFRFDGHRMRGIATLRPLIIERLDEAFQPSESELEALAWQVLSDPHLPPMLRQCPLPWAPTAGRVDLFIPDWGLVIELDGRRWHQRSEDFERDRARDNAAIVAGFTVLRFSWRMLVERPMRCLAQVKSVGERRAA